MQRRDVGNLAVGLGFILFGAALLAYQFIPGLSEALDLSEAWPLLLFGIGVLLIGVAAVGREPGLAVPGSVLTGLGLIFFWQNMNDAWETWSYVWALIPGFVGVGSIISGLLEGRGRNAFRDGSSLIILSLVLFAIFGSLLGGLNLLGAYWPLLLVLVGVLLILRPLFSARNP